ncbi:hypothetical protein [Paenibacillus polymyxa]|uniref:Uncharacterized protein n=1 Tax=Paenibacillus polymyxa TaxID=1406 RepID=A0AAP4A073_PAEPO|nr:hypothetical protein [Paenibacillus polymyxa]MDH2332473.1 hypothetical protein [Paenibacillus polymyxa]
MAMRVLNWMCAVYWLGVLVAVIAGSYTLDRFDSIAALLILIINFVGYGLGRNEL